VDDELIRWCALATRAACSRMTPQHLKALQDSVGQARCLPARFAWDRKATAHVQFFSLLADVIADRPGPAMLLNAAVGAIVLGSRRRLLELIRAGDAEGAAAEMEQHLRRLHFMWRLCRGSEPRGIAV
jgi:DNA-binding FadR family transcriptional regulator